MNSKEIELEKKISVNELEDENLTSELSKEQKKAAIRELKSRYGRGGAKKVLDWIKSLKADKETIHNLYGDFGGLREYNDPRNMR